MQSLPSQILKTQGINWKACIFWGLLIGGAILIFLNHETIMTSISKFQIDLSLLQNLTLDNILAFITKYAALFSLAGLGITFIYGFYQKHQANKAALQLVTAQQTANSEINTAYDTAETYRKQAETYKLQYEQASKNDMGEALSEAQGLVQQQKSQFALERANLLGQIQSLQDQLLLKETKTVEKIVVK